MKHTFIHIALTLAVAVATTSCQQCDRNKTTDGFRVEVESKPIDEASMQDDLNKSKTILYTIPSPIEMASIIKETGTRYDENLLSSLHQASKYSSNLKMALNLGIYSTDMSFASIFNQSQKTVEYLNSLKALTERLGIVQLLDDNTIRRMEEKRASKDEMLNIISEVYINANQYLNENNRKNIAVMVLTGGWTEGIYIALNLVDTNKKNKGLTERIVAQKMALSTIMSVIDSNNPNDTDEDLNYLKTKMLEIKTIFDEVILEDASFPVVKTDPDTHITTIKASGVGTLSAEVLEVLREKVNEIRQEFISIQ